MTGIDETLAATGSRLRELREQRRLTLADVEERTGISKSTLSRLESGGRKATLELLLPLAGVYEVTLDDLVRVEPEDPRVRAKPIHRNGMTMLPLTRRAGTMQAYKMVLQPGSRTVPQPRSHEGYDWLYVLRGRLRVVLGDQDFVMGEGEVAEFDTRVPHWFGSADGNGVELLSLFGNQGERVHVRARATGDDATG